MEKFFFREAIETQYYKYPIENMSEKLIKLLNSKVSNLNLNS